MKLAETTETIVNPNASYFPLPPCSKEISHVQIFIASGKLIQHHSQLGLRYCIVVQISQRDASFNLAHHADSTIVPLPTAAHSAPAEADRQCCTFTAAKHSSMRAQYTFNIARAYTAPVAIRWACRRLACIRKQPTAYLVLS